MFRLLAGLSTACLLSLGTSARAADDQPKDILEKAIKAHGGEELMTKYKAGITKSKGKITVPGVGEVEFSQETAYMIPDKFKESIQMTINGMNINVITRIVGDKNSIEVNGKEMDVPEALKDALKNAGHMIKVAKLVPLLKEKGFELSLIGVEKIEDKPAIGIRVTAKDQKDINLYFDKKTNMMVKMEFRSTDPFTQKECNEERIILEYGKDKEGLATPKKVLIKHDNEKFLELEVSEIEFLEKLDESEFKKP
jgi:hypothetical protein